MSHLKWITCKLEMIRRPTSGCIEILTLSRLKIYYVDHYISVNIDIDPSLVWKKSHPHIAFGV
jgi:hypothetical protein